MLKDSAGNSTSAQLLCPHCALCCNGVLFTDVRLQAGDNPARLKQLGVPLKEGVASARFPQPCSCLDGNKCRIYPDRPSRCRTFECHLLMRAQRNEVSEASALKLIREARRRAEEVRRILRELGDRDEMLPLSRRYRRMMRRPIDLADESAGDLRGELMLAVARLAETLERDFLT
jgi:Fe-S-cluster containining protein